jgi:hypothetical protein
MRSWCILGLSILDPAVLSWIALTLMNSFKHSETDFTSYELTFGSSDALHFKLPQNLDDYGQQDAFLQRLDANLQRIQQVSAEFQRKLAAERTSGNPSVQTTYKA